MADVDRYLTDRLVCVWHGRSDEYRGRPELRRALTGDERLTFERRRNELANAIEPPPVAADKTLRAAISAMLGGYPQMHRHDQQSAQAIAASYLYVVRDEPYWAVINACERIRSGRAGLNQSFAPTEPQFASITRRETDVYRRRLIETEDMLNARA